jgi:hypothetical protein
MSKIGGMAVLLAIAVCLSFVAPAGATFIGASIPLSNSLGGTIDINLGNILAGDSDAYGLAGMDVGVNWGVDYDLNTIAGYPYGYGGVGAVTAGTLGYDLGLSMDSVSGSGFDGSEWGIPLTQQGLTTTHFDKSWSADEAINSVAAML